MIVPTFLKFFFFFFKKYEGSCHHVDFSQEGVSLSPLSWLFAISVWSSLPSDAFSGMQGKIALTLRIPCLEDEGTHVELERCGHSPPQTD